MRESEQRHFSWAANSSCFIKTPGCVQGTEIGFLCCCGPQEIFKEYEVIKTINFSRKIVLSILRMRSRFHYIITYEAQRVIISKWGVKREQVLGRSCTAEHKIGWVLLLSGQRIKNEGKIELKNFPPNSGKSICCIVVYSWLSVF